MTDGRAGRDYSDEDLKAMLITIAKWRPKFGYMTTQPILSQIIQMSVAETDNLGMQVRPVDLSKVPKLSSEPVRTHGSLIGYYKVTLENKYHTDVYDVLHYSDGCYECVNGATAIFRDYGPEELER